MGKNFTTVIINSISAKIILIYRNKKELFNDIRKMNINFCNILQIFSRYKKCIILVFIRLIAR